MALPAFSQLETSMASALLVAFQNIVLTNGVHAVGAVLDRSVETVGEYGLTGERRDRITVKKADAAWFANGVAIHADPLTYSVAELLAMERTTWTLDRADGDDALLVTWWLK